MLKQLSAGRRSRRRVDIALDADDGDTQELAAQIYKRLAQKGFCTVHFGSSTKDLGGALSEVDALSGAGCFSRLPELLSERLLGDLGSARIARLDGEVGGHTLHDIDRTISSLGYSLGPWTQELGASFVRRSPVFLHEASADAGEATVVAPVELTDRMALDWLDRLACAKLLVLFFLGPAAGKLELRHEDDELLPFEVDVEPGTWVVLRPGQLSQTFLATPTLQLADPARACYIAGAWFLKSPHANPLDLRLVPRHCEGLHRWLSKRLGVLSKARDDDEQVRLTPVPRTLELLMNHMSQRGRDRQGAITGMAWDLPEHHGAGDAVEIFWASAMGCDYATEVPFCRWEHEKIFDPQGKLDAAVPMYARHCSFTDGIDLFDNQFFGMSPVESKQSDPTQKKLLEVAYSSMYEAGWNKKRLQKSLTGIYTAIQCGYNEACLSKELAALSGVGNMGSGSICCGRISFCLGLNGPTLTIDSEGSSSLVACHHTVHTLCQRPRMNDQAFVGGSYYSLTPLAWRIYCSMRELSARGRCLSFDNYADGWTIGEGSAGIFLEPFTQTVDGHVVEREISVPLRGLLSGSSTKNTGTGASLNAQSVQCLLDLFHAATEDACISPFDVDVVDLNAQGRVLQDAVEGMSTMAGFRNKSCDGLGALCVGAPKANQCAGLWASGMSALLRSLGGSAVRSTAPILHLRELNPNIDLDRGPLVIFPTEFATTNLESSYSCVCAYGFGGSNASLILYNTARRELIKESEQSLDALTGEWPLSFWPGGGGDLEEEEVPERCYTILGSWSEYEQPMEMQWEGNGRYGYTLPLGENRYEHFQILLDGNPGKVLHPSDPQAPSGSAAVFSGPSGGSTQNSAESIFEYSAALADGSSVSLDKFRSPVTLIVNTASKCAFTQQYDGLQKLFAELDYKGLMILAFPCNQFANQEPGSDAVIQAFKMWQGVQFPVLAKVDVNGPSAIPLYEFLKENTDGFVPKPPWAEDLHPAEKDIQWNFTKFLCINGKPTKRFSFEVEPGDMRKEIEEALEAAQMAQDLAENSGKQEVATEYPSDAAGLFWLLDGRGEPREDEGWPGDRYRIHLHAAGRHRMVDWEKLPRTSRPASLEVRPNTGSYYIAGGWSEWTFQRMDESSSAPGTFCFEHSITKVDKDQFLIVRNADWNQVFFPYDDSDAVAGPHFGGMAPNYWTLEGQLGDVINIEFKRVVENGIDEKHISFTKK